MKERETQRYGDIMARTSHLQVDMPTGGNLLSMSEDAVYRKISLRIMPLLFVSYLLAFLDRINVGYAQLQMK